MRILAVIPHYFAGGLETTNEARIHGSLARDPLPRVSALSSCIAALHQLFDASQSIIHIARKITIAANGPLTAGIDVVVCTTGDAHLIGSLDLGPGAFEHRQTNAPPRMLGFACRSLLRERLGLYDYYCYLEDDLILRDPWLFVKLSWFNGQLGDGRLLQPNRYEVAPRGLVRKAYVDGDLADGVISRFVNIPPDSTLRGRYLGRELNFVQARNPHSGCFFLNAGQMASWAARADFLDPDTSFIGPLESAATLGILRSFLIFKPAIENAAFLEIEHYGTAFIGMIRMPLEGELDRR